MILTNKTYLAVGSLILIAEKSGPLSLHEIAKVFRISVSYLEQIFYRLKQANLVLGVRGPSGGYILAHAATEIRLVSVLQALTPRPVTASNEDLDSSIRERLLQKMRCEVSQALSNLTLAQMMTDNPATGDSQTSLV